ncbi:hypothetical protein DPEC_G00208010 [Dallia pectoralis]|uniref:Uncharacterized protein n=1 Tax=Dallia pectoralis TaxID=75939 RepID=A0ACC2G5B2_DALPE|nr:hypothetical protein DPEC_G00208010 [Dallia pectoralis]
MQGTIETVNNRANVRRSKTTCIKVPTMEDTKKKNAQVLSLGRKDTFRLLDVYVRRSISLNDGTCEDQSKKRIPRKWVTLSEKHEKVVRPMSDTSIILDPSTPDKDTDNSTQPDRKAPNVAPSSIPGPGDIPEIEMLTGTENKSEGKKRSKTSYLWKTFLGFFSSKRSDKKDEQETVKRGERHGTTEKKKSMKRMNSAKKRFTIKSKIDRGSARKRSLARNRTNTEITEVETTILCVAPTDSYYEKVSEELEKIVHEVKETTTPQPDAILAMPLNGPHYEEVSEELEKIVHEVTEKPTPISQEEVIKRIIFLVKDHGDAMDTKLKENAGLSSFFQKLSYNTFMQLADTYVENQTPVVPTHQRQRCADNAPELVKLAFSMDFTAKLACLSRQSTNHILGLGHLYLEDRFTQTQLTTLDETVRTY